MTPAIFVIFVVGRLGYAKSGARSLAIADDNGFEYDDVIVYKGQFYVIDTLGNVSWIDNLSLKLVPFLPPLCGLGSQKHLVESCGALYVVDRYFNKERRRVEHTNWYVRDCDGPKVVDFKVYKLDEEWGRWELEKSLGDRALVLGNDCCLSILVEEFTGYKRNCIFFNDQNETHVFNLEDRSFGDLQNIYPSWLLSNLL